MLQKVIDFKIVRGESFQALEAAVRSGIADSWVPSGPIIAYNADVGQALNLKKFNAEAVMRQGQI